MKEFMVTIGLLILGFVIAKIILSDDSSSIKSASKNLMQSQVGALSD